MRRRRKVKGKEKIENEEDGTKKKRKKDIKSLILKNHLLNKFIIKLYCLDTLKKLFIFCLSNRIVQDSVHCSSSLIILCILCFLICISKSIKTVNSNKDVKKSDQTMNNSWIWWLYGVRSTLLTKIS